MHVIIPGGGVAASPRAYYLARAGHQVTVLDASPAPAWRPASPMPASLARLLGPLGAPGIPVKALKWMMMRHRPLVLCGRGSSPASTRG